jgi:hypothetical protein
MRILGDLDSFPYVGDAGSDLACGVPRPASSCAACCRLGSLHNGAFPRLTWHIANRRGEPLQQRLRGTVTMLLEVLASARIAGKVNAPSGTCKPSKFMLSSC